MKIDKFEDILSWKKGQELSILVYQIFGKCKDFGFKDQISRASISISNNIAEGFERRTDGELTHFLFIAKGSCGECRSMFYLAKQLNYITEEEFNILYSLCIEISRLISAFISSIKK